MLQSELIELVEFVQKARSESNSLEIKSAREGCPKIYDTLSSFSNQSGGGTIVFGIDETDFSVCGVYDAADIQKKIMEQSIQMEPEVRPLCTVAVVDGKTVVSAEIQEIDSFQKPCFYKGVGRLKGSYVRVGDGDRRMTEYEVYSFEAFRQKIQDELRTIDDAELSEIDTNSMTKYLIMLKDKKPNLAALPNEKIKSLQGFVKNGKPTLAGIMLFSEYPQAFYPQLCVTAVSVPGTEISMVGSVGERFLDNRRIDGTITQMLDQTLFFIRQNTRTKTIIDPNTGTRNDKPDYPVIAVRELLLNALIHRDYSIHTDSAPITVRIFYDRIEIENPGGLYGRMTLDQLGKVSADTRNPFLANALEVMEITENRFSGIPTVIAAMREAGLPAPKFESERGIFRATLYNDTASQIPENSREAELLDFCNTPRSREEIENFFKGRLSINYVMSDIVKPLVAEGKLKLTLPDKPKSRNQRYYKSR